MLNLLFGVSIIGNIIEGIKESYEKSIPTENWANKKLYRQDLANNVSAKQRVKYAEQGRYKLTENYPKPHRDADTGQIIIENDRLYREDVKKYGVIQAREWVYQGKYNLSPQELKKEEERMKKEWEEYYKLL